MLTEPITKYSRFLRIFARILGVTVLLILIAGIGAYILARQSLPDYDGIRRVEGLAHPVRILRDAFAIPHVFGETDEDVLFGLGYAHAQDRLWQMLLNRSTVQGRLSERFGERSLRFDRQMRILGLYRAASEDVALLSDEARNALRAYAAGVNAYLDLLSTEPRGRGAPELFFFGGAPVERWAPEDSLAVIKLMAFQLSGARYAEIQRAKLSLRMSPERLSDLMPPYPDSGVTEIPSLSMLFPGFRPNGGELDVTDWWESGLLGPPEMHGASNAWAASGARTSTGSPLLATDPHLGLSVPSIWYLARLEFRSSGGVIGATIPGLPAVVIGRNQNVGWGLSHAYSDDQDLYIEKLNTDDPFLYLTPEGWEPFQAHEEEIRIRGREKPEQDAYLVTRHGPVLHEDVFDLENIIERGHVAALRWTATDSGDRSYEAAFGLMKSKTIEEAIAALSVYVAPMQNVTIADETGVALVVAGKAPLRKQESLTEGRVPSQGWDVRNEWEGYLPYEDLPRAVRPESGVVANANNRTTEEPFPKHITHEWPAPYRIRRLQALLAQRDIHSQQSFRAIQNDTISEMALTLLPLMMNGLPGDGVLETRDNALRARVLERFRHWDGSMNQDLSEPLIFVTWLEALTQRLLANELGELSDELRGQRPQFLERVLRNTDGAGVWCDVRGTATVEICAQASLLALDEAIATLQDEYGEDLVSWRWGRAHVAVHRHLPFGVFGPFRRFFNIEHESSGGNYTLQRAQFSGRGEQRFANVHSAGFRAIYNFGQLNRSEFIISTGQSGHFLSRHYDDLSEIWRNGEYLLMSLSPADVEAGSVGTVELVPK